MDVPEFNLEAARMGFADLAASRMPARCLYDSHLFRAVVMRHHELGEQPLHSCASQGQQQRLRQRPSGSSRVLARLSSGNSQDSSRSAMLVRRSLREALRQQQQIPLTPSPSVVSLLGGLDGMPPRADDAVTRSPTFASQDQLLEHLGRLFADACRDGGGSAEGSQQRRDSTASAALADSARAIADCLLGMPPPPTFEDLRQFARHCLDQVRPDSFDEDREFVIRSQLKVFGLLLALERSGASDALLGSSESDDLLKWCFNELRSHLFSASGRVSDFLSDQLAPAVSSCRPLVRLVRDLRQEIGLPVSDDEEADDDEEAGGDVELATQAGGSAAIGIDCSTDDANADYPDLTTSVGSGAVPFYCGSQPTLFGGADGVSGLVRSSSVLRGMTTHRQLFVPASAGASVANPPRSKKPRQQAHQTPPRTPSPGASGRRRGRIRVMETPTPKQNRLRLQRLASERTRGRPIVVRESPCKSPSGVSRAAAAAHELLAGKENLTVGGGASRFAARADDWVRKQQTHEEELTRFDLLVPDDAGDSCGSAASSQSLACRRISFQSQQSQPSHLGGGSSQGGTLSRRASQLFANLLSSP